jgi:hypothetical protein
LKGGAAVEIDAPEQAVAIWLEGDHIMCRFPTQQLVSFDTLAQLMVTLKHREVMARRCERMTVATNGAPVQYDIDKIAEALKGKEQSVAHYEEVAKKGAETRERERTRLLRKDAKMQREKRAERELRELNLL